MKITHYVIAIVGLPFFMAAILISQIFLSLKNQNVEVYPLDAERGTVQLITKETPVLATFVLPYSDLVGVDILISSEATSSSVLELSSGVIGQQRLAVDITAAQVEVSRLVSVTFPEPMGQPGDVFGLVIKEKISSDVPLGVMIARNPSLNKKEFASSLQIGELAKEEKLMARLKFKDKSEITSRTKIYWGNEIERLGGNLLRGHPIWARLWLGVCALTAVVAISIWVVEIVVDIKLNRTLLMWLGVMIVIWILIG